MISRDIQEIFWKNCFFKMNKIFSIITVQPAEKGADQITQWAKYKYVADDIQRAGSMIGQAQQTGASGGSG